MHLAINGEKMSVTKALSKIMSSGFTLFVLTEYFTPAVNINIVT